MGGVLGASAGHEGTSAFSGNIWIFPEKSGDVDFDDAVAEYLSFTKRHVDRKTPIAFENMWTKTSRREN
jgi:hypothetical protein